MMESKFSIALLSLCIGLPSLAQQIPGAPFPTEFLGLSAGCLAAVNQTVSSCPRWLPTHAGTSAASFDLLEDSKLLEQICETSCAADLENTKKAIEKACTSETDVMVPGASVAYPATFLADRYLYAIQIGCLKSKSGEYCDSVVTKWQKEGSSSNWTSAQICSECELGVQKVQLSSPFGFDEAGAADFASLTSSCQATGYAYATPTSYAINATDTAPSPARTCVSTYTIQEEDTCVSISVSQGVSTHGIIKANGFDISCNMLLAPGSQICLPAKCETYQLEMYETCDAIVDFAHITKPQLMAWNPMLSSWCNDLLTWYGWNLCISSPNGVIKPGEGDAVATDAPVPDNAQSQSNKHCGKWYLTQEGDLCDSISMAFGITVKDFYFLNPQVDDKCSNLWLETSYCVKPVGNIATYSGYPVSTPPTVFPKPTPEPTKPYTPVGTQPLSAIASGTADDCEYYQNAFESWLGDVIDNFDLSEANSCNSWAAGVGITVEQLLAWNPSLSKDSCTLQAGKSYCIYKDEGSSSSPTATPTQSEPSKTTGGSTPKPTSSGSVPPPAETQAGVISSCKKWYVVAEGDGCWGIANEAGIELSDFYKWNPGVKECAELWPSYAVCIGV
ncbi:carbohydrate-binding module family 50 protein [Periconia macrospinosa]|uniref:Carbohydrate-binding module family 50 protein n=1 Tax=Periconia macrospinosa TaxID=97972 RepID=A0A2V1EDS4_9PLEO|nr:carbohydrate-binding module family 50 protein [Periconia macrospinosa]